MSDDLGVLDRYLTVWIGLAMVVGVALGRFVPGVADVLNSVTWHGTSLPIALGLFVMIFPIMAEIDYGRIPRVTRTARKEIGLTLAFNWLVAPFLMYGLAVFFLGGHPEFVTGLVIVGIAPCIAMVLVWNELAAGNQEMCAVCVGVNSLLQIALFVPYAFLFLTVLRGTAVDVSMGLVAQMVLVFLGLPLALGYLAQRVAFRTIGREAYYGRVVPRIGPFGLLGLLFTVVVMFALKGDYIVSNPGEIVLIAVPLFVFFAGLWAVAYGVSAFVGFDYAESVSVAFTAASNNFELAIAVAVAVFGIESNVALATVVGPLIEVPVMLALVRVALATRDSLFADAAGTSGPAYSD
ncbi:ACR3 family arsenite efflux transporter [Halorussus gelatinilyticus]|uniref:ACR3 family arsenite efflux transporter n=1 Tax=Halorussus gelatinilyticus TaxID=2937524 RepID=A0A8U0IN89_9EURY|nr:ACR3 family arsenite efflux transporter [Halorussus gelatinilyticus]UPW02095.1 ACR3 family arsenite efflux transporter [Halorussus gelatinilyticus]